MKKIILLSVFGLLFSMISMAKTVDVKVTSKGFEPAKIEAKAGEPLTLNITREAKITCAKKITIPSMDVTKDLPLNKMVSVEVTPKEKGEIKFGCAMDQMLGGAIIVQ